MPSRIKIASLQVVDFHLPEEVEHLQDLAYNLWWTWNHEARLLFSAVDRASWARYRNPVELLLNADPVHWEGLVEDDVFMNSYNEVIRSLDAYLDPETTWFAERWPQWAGGPVAYFSMEYGLHQSLPLYSGGLGVLSGDHAKSASDLGVPFVAVGLLYRLGYFRQAIDADGYQQHIYPETDFLRLPLRPVLSPRGQELAVRVPLPGREVVAKVWLAQVGRVPLLLLDTDVVENDPADRPITNVLYVRGREARLTQEAVLGIGGARALEALDIEPSVWHINEGHSALLQLERLRRAEGASADEALAALSRRTAFTTHTPVPAGHEEFAEPMVRRYLEVWTAGQSVGADRILALGAADHGEKGQPLNLTALALRTSAWVNGVSRINARVGGRMWRHVLDAEAGPAEIVAITNGVHAPTWLGPEVRALLGRHLGPDWSERLLEEGGWEGVLDIPAAEIWEAHQAQKSRLSRFARARLLDQYARHGRSPDELRAVAAMLDPEILTVGFARRFATYKRAGLLFSDLHRLRALVGHPERPLQVILAGKAHPADRPGQDLIRHIFHLSQERDLKGRVVFLENYDMRIGRMLTQGCDVWLNTPRRPLEASGTSGQKAAMNGVLNVSVLDGWWPEAHDGTNGWAIGGEGARESEDEADRRDARDLYQLLEEEVTPLFYERAGELPDGWVERMRRSIYTVTPAFAARRMVRDYVERAYVPLATG